MLEKKKNRFKKRRAVYLLVACQQDEKIVARELGIKVTTLRAWMKEASFAEELEKAMQRIEAFDAKHRAKENKLLATKLYSELHRRLSSPKELRDIPISNLIRMARELNHEVRVDTPGDVTSRGETTHKHELMDDLIARYKQFEKEKTTGEKPNLHLVEPPEEEKDKEAANG